MRKLFHKIRLGPGTSGFTMIELLVVIAVIGVLAVAVLSSINPVEQINKGRDTRVRSNAAQLMNAMDRFYAIHELYPWNDATYNGSGGSDSLPGNEFPGTETCTTTFAQNGTTFCQMGGTGYSSNDWLDALAQTDEVKESFVNQVENTKSTNVVYIFKDDSTSTDDTVYVCFPPSSKAFQQQALDDCETRSTVLPAGACPAASYPATSYTAEFICLP